VRLDKGDFVGRHAVQRTSREPLDRRLVGLEMDPPAPIEGAVIWYGAAYAGYVTSSAHSPALGRAVMLGWVELVDGALPEELTIDGRPARRVATPFYDPAGERARATLGPSPVEALPLPPPRPASPPPGGFEVIEGTRVVASPAALDAARWPAEARVLRTAPDEALITARVDADAVPDPHAIVVRETGFAGRWLDRDTAAALMERGGRFELPWERPAFAQGALAEIPVKLWLEAERVLLVVPAALAAELVERTS
jgi:hypothetical protein